MRPALACLMWLAVLVNVGCTSGRNDVRAEQSNALHGAQSNIQQPRILLVSDQRIWTGLWHEHTANREAAAPAVDFSHEVVVAFFQGERLNQTDLLLHDAVESPETFTMHFVGEHRQTSVSSAFISHPYHFAIMPRLPKTIVVTFDIRREKAAPPQWSELARLSAIQP